MRSILFVCTANICRSPMAEMVFQQLVTSQGAADQFEILSAATHDFFLGVPPFATALETATKRGYCETGRVSRRIQPGDFAHFDMILAMDRSNVAALRSLAPTRSKQKIELLLEYSDKYHGQEVPDPYRGTMKDFELALDMIEDGCRGLAKLLLR